MPDRPLSEPASRNPRNLYGPAAQVDTTYLLRTYLLPPMTYLLPPRPTTLPLHTWQVAIEEVKVEKGPRVQPVDVASLRKTTRLHIQVINLPQFPIDLPTHTTCLVW